MSIDFCSDLKNKYLSPANYAWEG